MDDRDVKHQLSFMRSDLEKLTGYSEWKWVTLEHEQSRLLRFWNTDSPPERSSASGGWASSEQPARVTKEVDCDYAPPPFRPARNLLAGEVSRNWMIARVLVNEDTPVETTSPPKRDPMDEYVEAQAKRLGFPTKKATVPDVDACREHTLRWMSENGVSIRALAKASGFQPSNLSPMLSGKAKMSLMSVERIYSAMRAWQ